MAWKRLPAGRLALLCGNEDFCPVHLWVLVPDQGSHFLLFTVLHHRQRTDGNMDGSPRAPCA